MKVGYKLTETQIQVVPMNATYLRQVQELLKEISPFSAKADENYEIWQNFSSQSNQYSIICRSGELVIGYGALVIEFKIRGGKLGHIEDIVTHPNFRNLGVGSVIIEHLTKIAENKGCYKVVLNCSETNVDFYKKCGLRQNGISMTKMFNLENC